MAAHFLDLPATDRLWWGGTEIRALWWGKDLVWGEVVGRSREDFAVAARDGSGLPEPFATPAGRLRTLAPGG
jgi:hypothetical protein